MIRATFNESINAKELGIMYLITIVAVFPEITKITNFGKRC